MANILILGAGRVGCTVAEQLVLEQHNVTIVDANPQNLRPLQDQLDLRTVVGLPSSPAVMEAAGARDAELLLAVTPSDEVNMVACKLAHELFRIPVRLARVREADYLAYPALQNEQNFAIDEILTPAQIVAGHLANLAAQSAALQSVKFGGGRLQLLVVKVGREARITGQQIYRLDEFLPGIDRRIVAIYRQGKRITPDGDTLMHPGDEVFLLVASQHAEKVTRVLHGDITPVKRITIAGGGNVGYRLAKLLQDDYQVKLIEMNRDRARWLAEQLPKVLVLAGKASDEALLEGEQIDRADLYIAITSDDEDNIMSSLLAKDMGARKVITLINRERYIDLLQGGRIDVAFSPAQLTIGALLSRVRHGDIVSVRSLRRGAAEALEIVAHGSQETSRVVGRRIEEIQLPPAASIAAIIRGSEVLMAHHDTEIQADDHVVVFVDNKRNIREVERLFAVKIGFF
jgi:trk system potassium uptake protein